MVFKEILLTRKILLSYQVSAPGYNYRLSDVQRFRNIST